jgi:opacity protein-like surface antigen
MKKFLCSLAIATVCSHAGGAAVAPKSDIVSLEEKRVSNEIPLLVLSDVYFGIGVGKATLDVSGTNEQLSAKAATFIAGFDINKYVGIEGRYSRAFSDATYKPGNIDIASTYSNAAIYLKAQYQIKQFKPYILLGYGETQFTNLENFDRAEAGFQYGAGLEYEFDTHWSVFVDYVREYDGKGFDGRASLEDITVDHATLGIKYHF